MWYCAFCFVRRATTDLQFFEAQHVVSIVVADCAGDSKAGYMYVFLCVLYAAVFALCAAVCCCAMLCVLLCLLLCVLLCVLLLYALLLCVAAV